MSDMKCPFCGEEIKIAGERTTIMSCFNGECCGSGLYGEEAMWQALIQAKQDLKIATKALEEIDWCAQDYAKAQEALEHITRDNSEKPNSQEHKE